MAGTPCGAGITGPERAPNTLQRETGADLLRKAEGWWASRDSGRVGVAIDQGEAALQIQLRGGQDQRMDTLS